MSRAGAAQAGPATTGGVRVRLYEGRDWIETLAQFYAGERLGEFRLHGVPVAEYRRLVALGWRPPDNRYSAGARKLADKRRAIVDFRRVLVKWMFDQLPQEQRLHPYTDDDQAVRAIHKKLVEWSAMPEAEGNPVLANCRKITQRTIREDLVKTFRQKRTAS